MGIFLPSEAELAAVAANWIRQIERPALIYLSGDLGAGKTCFVRAALRALGFEDNVKSPTFSLLETYQLKDQIVHHMDLYRLTDPEELEYLGFRDLLADADLLFIEWPEQAAAYLPTPTHRIRLTYKKTGGQVGREIHIVNEKSA